MDNANLILMSGNEDLINKCRTICCNLSLSMICRNNFPDFIFELYQNDCMVAILNCTKNEIECVTTVRLIRKLRPRVPLIVLCEAFNEKFEHSILSEGIFYLGLTTTT